MRHSRKGITLAELVVSIGIIGVLSFLLPILVRLFNTLAYLQQKSLLQKEAKAVLWQMSHEMANAVRVDVAPPHGEDCVNAVDANADCMRIWTYDFQKYYDSGKYELPAMYGPSPMDHLSAKARYGRIMYEVVSETTADINGNGRIDTKPYLLKRVIWPAAWGPRPVVSSTQTFFSGRIVKTTTPYP
jgi:type II secretory pathway pseudopilin PulG